MFHGGCIQAAFHGHAALAQLLIDSGASIIAEDQYGDTPLVYVSVCVQVSWFQGILYQFHSFCLFKFGCMCLGKTGFSTNFNPFVYLSLYASALVRRESRQFQTNA